MLHTSALVFVHADKMAVVCRKAQVSLTGSFDVGEEIDLPWRDSDGTKTRYLATIVKTSAKGKLFSFFNMY